MFGFVWGPSIPANREEVRAIPSEHVGGSPDSRVQPGMNRVLFLLSLSVLINYIDRSNLSIAAPLIKTELHISNTQLGTLLSAFFWTYALMQIPAGWLVDRFDVKWVFSAGFLLWTVATGTTGLLHGFAALLGIRVILGIGESVAFPSYSKILCGHFKEEHRGFANALLLAGLALGPAIGMMVGGRVVGRFGWRPFFLVLGMAGLLWLVPWLAWMPRRVTQPHVVAATGVGYLHILRQRSVWGTCLGQASVNYYLYFLVTWLPFYLVRGRHLSMNDMARDGGLLFVMYAVGTTIAGKLSDRWIQAGSSPTIVRKGTMAFGCMAFGISVALLALASSALLIWMLALTGFLLGVSACATWAIPQTLAGAEMVGRWTGMQNFIGNLGGAVAPFLTGYLLDRTGEFYWPFFITAGVAWIGGASWTFIVGPIEEVTWNVPRKSAAPAVLPLAENSQP